MAEHMPDDCKQLFAAPFDIKVLRTLLKAHAQSEIIEKQVEAASFRPAGLMMSIDKTYMYNAQHHQAFHTLGYATAEDDLSALSNQFRLCTILCLRIPGFLSLKPRASWSLTYMMIIQQAHSPSYVTAWDCRQCKNGQQGPASHVGPCGLSLQVIAAQSDYVTDWLFLPLQALPFSRHPF